MLYSETIINNVSYVVITLICVVAYLEVGHVSAVEWGYDRELRAVLQYSLSKSLKRLTSVITESSWAYHETSDDHLPLLRDGCCVTDSTL